MSHLKSSRVSWKGMKWELRGAEDPPLWRDAFSISMSIAFFTPLSRLLSPPTEAPWRTQMTPLQLRGAVYFLCRSSTQSVIFC